MKFSIITVTYNSVNSIEKSIRSVLAQSYPDREYIIIDGGSKDGTVDIIRHYSDRINYWVSEPDKGIYDAMNKGIKIATGDYLIFMNADDVFADTEVLQKVAGLIKADADVIYGNWRTVTKQASSNIYLK